MEEELHLTNLNRIQISSAFDQEKRYADIEEYENSSVGVENYKMMEKLK